MDYIKLQGGVPQITYHDGIWHIKHAYRDDQPEVTTHIAPTDRGTVCILFEGEVVEFEVAKLWQFEGAPCESSSKSRGGEGYRRHREK